MTDSQQIEKLCIEDINLEGNNPTASRDLARFVCLLPCLTDLMIEEYIRVHDDFYQELARLASSSKVIFKVLGLVHVAENLTLIFFIPYFVEN